MPTSVSTALLVFGIILALTGASTFAVLAGVAAIVVEVILFVAAGLD